MASISKLENTLVRNGGTRPGGRTARVSKQIHDAVLELLATSGHGACTFQNVARLAGVERSTLYRRYADRWSMIFDSYASRAQSEVAITPTGDFPNDFKLLLRRFAQLWSTPIAAATLTMVLGVRGTPAQAQIGQFLERRYAQFDGMFDAAEKSGSLPIGTNRRELLDRATGIIIFQLVLRNDRVDDEWLDRLTIDLQRIYGWQTPGRSTLQMETAS